MQAENAKHAAEMLKRSGELAGTARKYWQVVPPGKRCSSCWSKLKTLPAVHWSCWGSIPAQKTPRKHSLLRKAAGAAILTGTALYLVPECRGPWRMQ